MTRLRLLRLASLALLLAAGIPGAAEAFRIEAPTQTQYILMFRKLPSEDPPFLHWDLREFPNCSVPYSYAAGTADIAGTAEFDRIDDAFGTWAAVSPAAITFNRVPAPGGAGPPGRLDGSNMIGWVSGFNGGISGDDSWLVAAANQQCGANAGANTPIIGPGADAWLTTLANNCIDDVCIGIAACACGTAVGTPNALIIAPGANGALETTPNNCDVWDGAIAPASQVCGANVGANVVIIRAGIDGVLDTAPNNCPGGGDDMVMGAGANAVIHAGADGFVNTVIGDDLVVGGSISCGPDGRVQTRVRAGDDAYDVQGRITAGPDGLVNTVPSGNLSPFTFALTPTFFNLTTGQILESDIIINDLYTWQDAAQGATMAGNPDVRMIMTHEIGHLLGLHHPVPDVSTNPPGAAFNAIMSTFSYINDDTWVVAPVNQVCFANVGANAPIIAPGPNGWLQTAFDNCNIVNDDGYQATTGRITAGANGRVNTTIQADRVNHVLQADDIDGINFLYTPDLGDADDPFMALGFNRYQTKVQSAANGRILNGVQLRAPALGPVHLFGWNGTGPTGNSRFEWMGNTMDTPPLEECGPWLPNQDPSDDGVTFPPTPLTKGMVHNFTVTINYNNAGRYNGTVNNDTWIVAAPDQLCGGTVAANGPILGDGGNGFETAPNNCPGGGDDLVSGNQIIDGGNGVVETVIPVIRNRQLFFNGLFDFQANGRFSTLEDFWVYWTGFPPGTTTTVIPNTTTVNFDNANNRIILTFPVPIPINAQNEFFLRSRLDYGEDEGRELALSGDLRRAEGVAQFGEVEDDRLYTTDPPVATLLTLFLSAAVADGIEIRWQWVSPGLFDQVSLERADASEGPWIPIDAEIREEGGTTVALDRAVEDGRTYYYRLVGTADHRTTTFGPLAATAGAPITRFALERIVPNPAPGSARIDYAVPTGSDVRVVVVDLQGREIAVLAEGHHRPGRYHTTWDGETRDGDAAAGVYFVQLQSAASRLVQRIVWMK